MKQLLAPAAARAAPAAAFERHQMPFQPPSQPAFLQVMSRSLALRANIYDDWSLDLLSTSQSSYTYDELQLPYCDEDAVEQCLEEFMESDYGKTMFGRHDLPASVGITGSIELVALEGPACQLALTGKFWHKRVTVLGKAAMYINARLPELTSITVSSPEDLEDFQDVIDELTGEVLYVEDKRSPDFNGDRETMEYQGLNPDVRGPFVLFCSVSVFYSCLLAFYYALWPCCRLS
ncbi:hypothetical protein ACHAW6_004023 [Cyclotella cf. meneghiniana]